MPIQQPVVDVHAHAVPAEWITELVRGRERFPHVTVTDTGDGASFAYDGEPPGRPVAPYLLDADARGAWLTAQGIDRQVVGGWVDTLGYQLPGDEGAAWSRLLSEKLVELCAGDERLTPLGAVPLQAPERAADALRSTLAAGCAGVMIGTQPGGLELDDAVMTPFWEAADELGAAVFLHPSYHSTGRYAAYGLANGLARLEDSTIAVARLLLAGVPARFPGLKLVVAHGGGAVPYVLGRLARNEAVTGSRHADPVESFAHLYFDTVVYDPGALALLVRRAGAERVMLGSDHPFPMADPPTPARASPPPASTSAPPGCCWAATPSGCTARARTWAPPSGRRAMGSPPQPAPERIGPYQVLGYLGEGGMGHVHKARAPDGKLVAVKVVRPGYAAIPEFRARFRREVASAMRVPRFCTAEVLGAATDGELLYLVTEFIDGPTLHAAVRADGPWEAAGLEQLGVSTAAALVAIHGAGVIHRDLKPSNVLLSRSGPRVIDFGVARALDVAAEVTRTDQLVGTPGFVAPEQYQGLRPGPAVDVFAWGGVMAFAATGRYPFGSGEPPAVAYRVVHGEPDLAGLEGALRELVEAALSKDPSARPTPATLQERLGVRATPTDAPGTLVMPPEPAEPAPPPATPEAGPVTPRRPPKPSRRVAGLGLAGALLAVSVAVAAAFLDGAGEPPPTSAPPVTSLPPDEPDQVFAIEIPSTVGDDQPGTGAGSLERLGDTDVYRFTGVRDERVFIEALGCPPDRASTVLTLNVTGPEGRMRVDRPEFCKSGEPVDPGVLILPADGTYELVVHAGGTGTGTYGLRLRHPDLERLEIGYGRTVAPGDPPGAGEIAAPGDVDIYHLQGQAGDRILLTAEDCQLGAGALRYIVWEPGSTDLTGVVAVGDICARGSGSGQASTTLPVSGEYEITMDAAGHGDTGTYRLTVTKE